MSLLSNGPFSYNRFDDVDKIYKSMYEAKKAAKDYDGDGEVESGKEEYFGSKDKAIKKAMGKKSDCGCDDKKEVKENRAMANGGHRLVGDGSKPKGPTNPKNKTQTMMGKDGKPLFKEGNIDESSCGSKGYQKGGKVEKKDLKKEHVLDYLVQEGFATNEVSAEVLFNHMTDDWLEHIEGVIVEGFKPLPMQKMAKQSDKAYGKETVAVKSGNQPEANKQMQRRIAMKNPAGQKVMLQKKNA